MTKLADIEHRLRVAAPRERVWRMVTEADFVGQWLGCIGYEARIGHLFYMQPDPARRSAGDATGATHCELVELEAPARMQFSWFMPGTPKTFVTIDLADNGDGSTTARLRHEGWDQFDGDQMRAIRDMLDGGWSSFVLPGLQRCAEAAETS